MAAHADLRTFRVWYADAIEASGRQVDLRYAYDGAEEQWRRFLLAHKDVADVIRQIEKARQSLDDATAALRADVALLANGTSSDASRHTLLGALHQRGVIIETLFRRLCDMDMRHRTAVGLRPELHAYVVTQLANVQAENGVNHDWFERANALSSANNGRPSRALRSLAVVIRTAFNGAAAGNTPRADNDPAQPASDDEVFWVWYQEVLNATDEQLSDKQLDAQLYAKWNRHATLEDEIRSIIEPMWKARKACCKATFTLWAQAQLIAGGDTPAQSKFFATLRDRDTAIADEARLLQEFQQLQPDRPEFKRMPDGKDMREYIRKRLEDAMAAEQLSEAWLDRVNAFPPPGHEGREEAVTVFAVEIGDHFNDIVAMARRRPPGPDDQPPAPAAEPARNEKRKRSGKDDRQAGGGLAVGAIRGDPIEIGSDSNPRPQRRRKHDFIHSAAVGAARSPLPNQAQGRAGANNAIVISDSDEDGLGLPNVPPPGRPTGVPSGVQPSPVRPVVLGGREVILDKPLGDGDYKYIMDRIYRRVEELAEVEERLPQDFIAYCVNCMFNMGGRVVRNIDEVCAGLRKIISDELPPRFPWGQERPVVEYGNYRQIDSFGPFRTYLHNLVSQEQNAQDGEVSVSFFDYVSRNLELFDGHPVQGANRIASRILSLFFEYPADHDWSNEAPVRFGETGVEELAQIPGFDARRNNIIDNDEGTWTLDDQVGAGGNGRALLYVKHNNHGQIIGRTIVKESFQHRTWNYEYFWYQSDRDRRIPIEAGIHGLLPDHPSIVKLLGYGVYKQLRLVRIYTEYCSLGDAYSMVREQKNYGLPGNPSQNDINKHQATTFPTLAIWAWFELAAAACCIMHHGRVPDDDDTLGPDGTFKPLPDWPHDIVHRDIKAPNFFLATPEQDTLFYPRIPLLKLGDFGNALDLPSLALPTDANGGGTPGIMAPEQMDYDKTHNFTPDSRSNTWQIGYAIFCLMAMRIPSGSTQPKITDASVFAAPGRGREMQCYNSYPAELRGLVERCVAIRPDRRIGVAELYLEVRREVMAWPPGNHTVPVEFQRLGEGEVVCTGRGGYVRGFAN